MTNSNEGMRWRDWVKLAVGVLGAIAGAEVSASPATWAQALAPGPTFGAIAALCGVAAAWLANAPKKGGTP